jgi:outer membrane biosynthesis protein TonB
MTTLVGVFRKVWLWDWLRGRRGRGRQVAAVAIYGFVALVVIGAASPSTKKKASPVAQVRPTGSQPSLQQQPAPKRVDGRHARRARSQSRARHARGKTHAAAKPKAQPAPTTTTRPTSTRPSAPPPTATRPTTTTATTTSTNSTSSGANCTPGYSPCIPLGPDVDCAGGSGNGPRYVQGPVQVTGSDPYRLDANGDGVGCDS